MPKITVCLECGGDRHKLIWIAGQPKRYVDCPNCAGKGRIIASR